MYRHVTIIKKGHLLIICSNTSPLYALRTWNISDLEYDVARSLKVRSNVGLGLREFLLMPVVTWYDFAPFLKYKLLGYE